MGVDERSLISNRLKSSRWEDIYVALKFIKQGKYREFLSEVVDALDHDNVAIRVMAVQVLGEIGDESHLEILWKMMADPEEWVRVRTVEALGKLGTKEKIADMLVKFLESEMNEKVKATILKVLSSFQEPKYIPVISLYLRDKDRRVRANAIEALENIGATNIKEILQPYIEDSDHRVKANIAKALWSSGSDEWINILKFMLRDKDDWTRAAAAWALGEIKSDVAYKLLVDAIGDETWFVNNNIIKAIKKHGDVTLKILIRRFKKEKDEFKKESILRAIVSLESKKAVNFLLSLLDSSPSPRIRRVAEEALDNLVE
jgi:HEAT repeat protein